MSQPSSDKPEYEQPAAGKSGMTALHHAAYLNDPEQVREELAQGSVPVNTTDDGGWTPLHWSIDMAQAWGEPEQVVEILLKAGANPNATDNEGRTPLMIACERISDEIIDRLLDAGADVRLRNARTTPLHVAATYDFAYAIKRLLAAGADPNEKDSFGHTPLQIAEEAGYAESTALLRAVDGR